MKKLLLIILIALLTLLSIYTIIEGIEIGNIDISGIKGIKNKNEELDLKVEQATRLANVNYKQSVVEVQESVKKLATEKKNYEELTIMNSDNNTQVTSQIQKYEIETLWVTIGNHATSEGVIIKMDITKGTNNIQGTYNLKFQVTGSYISITDFISDIENDTTLGFKIENFKMIPSTQANKLEATFVCNDIYIQDIDTSVVVTDNTTESQNTNGTQQTNAQNTNEV